MAGDELLPVVGAVSFASRHDFSGIEKLRGFEALVRARVQAAREAGADAGLLARLEEAAAGYEEKDRAGRVAALEAVIVALAPLVPLPEALAARLPEASSATSTAPVGASAPAAGAGASAPAAGAGASAPAGRSGDAVAARPGVPEWAAALAVDPAPADPRLDAPPTGLPGIGPSRTALLAARGLNTVRDLLWFLPVSYLRRTRAARIADLEEKTRSLVVGTVERAGVRFYPRRGKGFEAVLTDGSGKLTVRYYRGGDWIAKRYAVGERVAVSGEVRRRRGRLEMAHPEILDADQVADDEDEGDALLPRYSDVEGIPGRTVRLAVAAALPAAARLPDPLPPALREKRGLLAPGEAVTALHAPDPDGDLEALNERRSRAHQRLIYEEFFFLQLGLALKARGVRVQPGIAFPVDDMAIEWARSLAPFELTAAQHRVLDELAGDLRSSEPMHRLLQGDVGSGKTVVAAMALALVVRAGWQGAVMAPTELLAEQHGRTLRELLEPAGVRIAYLSGRLGAPERREALAAIASGEAGVVIGTHALIQEGVDFHRLGLVVVDEQHRFGVRQRAELIAKGHRADVLVMTATPIPRTLSMTAYGDLDVSVLDELPPGRTPVKTRVYSARSRESVWKKVRAEVAAGRQAYIVYPLVEESDRLEDVRAATEMSEKLAGEVFPDLRVGLIHGRLAPAEKDAVMQSFAGGALDILVATTVIEVGIDVANATVMVVEHAERFGLSQLHQLRGRVGRGAARSHCLLIAHEVRGEKVRERLSVMEETGDGFRIAEEDLRIRGPGELLGTRQSGHPDLLFGNLARDRTLLSQARMDAFGLVETDPDLALPEHRAAAREVLVRWGERVSLGRVG